MIEKFTEKDLPKVVELEKACFSIPWSETSLRMLLAEPYCGFTLRKEGRIVAYVGMLSVAGEAQVLNLATLPEYRGQGCGRRLLKRLFAEAKAKSCSTVTLEVRESNVAARGLYGAVGFVEVGQRPDYYQDPREAAIIMEKTL